MLILSRRPGESLKIGDDIIVYVMPDESGRRTTQVRIGIEAPRHIKVLRSELEKHNGNR